MITTPIINAKFITAVNNERNVISGVMVNEISIWDIFKNWLDKSL